MSEQLMLDTDENGSYILPPKRTFLVIRPNGRLRSDYVMLEAHSVSQTDGSLRFHEFTIQKNLKGEEGVLAWERRAFAPGQWAEFQEVFDVSGAVN